MKIIKVCGKIASQSSCQRTGIFLFSCMLCSCAQSAKIPFQQTVYKMTYEYLRFAECLSERDNQPAYVACDRSYYQDFARYSQLREAFVNEHEQQKLILIPKSNE